MTDDPEQNDLRPQNSQFSIRDILLVMTVIAVWIAYLIQFSVWKGPGIGMVTGIGVVGGMLGHLAYSFLLRWRVTTVLTPLATFCVFTLLFFVVSGQLTILATTWFLAEVLIAPASELFRSTRMLEWHQLMGGIIVALLFLPVHGFRPNWPTAIITALGVLAWYSTGLFICIAR